VTKWLMVTTLTAAVLCAPPTVHAQAAAAPPQTAAAPAVPPAFEKDIMHLLDVTGAQRLGETMANNFMQQFSQALRTSNPNVPPRALEIANEVAHKFFSERYPTLLPRMVQAYAKVLTPDDVKQMLAFYETPLGKRLIAVTPALAVAGAQAGQEWGQEMIPELQKELATRFKAEGLIQ
jgi:hypothetical protein